GRNERGDARLPLCEELVDQRARHPAVALRAVVEAEAREQVGGCRCREEADGEQEPGRLDEARVPGDAVEHLAVQHREDECSPHCDCEHDGRAAERHRPLARDARHRRHWILMCVRAPLAADAAASRAQHHGGPSVPVLTPVGSPGALKSGCHGAPGSAGSAATGWSPFVYQRAWYGRPAYVTRSPCW